MARNLASVKSEGEVAAFLDVENRTALRVPMMAWSEHAPLHVTKDSGG
jgi:hypothetical protein